MSLSLSRKDYKWLDFGKYLLKRALRILPLYWSVIACIVLLWSVWGVPVSIKAIVANMFFVVDLFTDVQWFNPVFSTLGVEVQFYILLGLVFPLFKKHKLIKYLILLLWLLSSYFTIHYYSVLYCAPVFIIGILLHDIHQGEKWSALAVIVIIMTSTFWYYPLENTVIILITLMLFLFLKPTWKPLIEIGKASYSLYLTHGIFGGVLLFYATSEAHGNSSSPWWILVATVVSILGAFMFYWVIEKPATRWSRSVKMRKKTTRQ